MIYGGWLAAFAGIFLNLLLPNHQNNVFQWWEKLKLLIKTRKEQKNKKQQKRKNTEDNAKKSIKKEKIYNVISFYFLMS